MKQIPYSTVIKSGTRREIFNCVTNWLIDNNGLPPTNREVGECLGGRSTSIISNQIVHLRADRVFERTVGQTRTFSLIGAIYIVPENVQRGHNRLTDENIGFYDCVFLDDNVELWDGATWRLAGTLIHKAKTIFDRTDQPGRLALLTCDEKLATIATAVSIHVYMVQN